MEIGRIHLLGTQTFNGLVQSLEWTGDGGFVAVSTLTINPVPEPETYALMLAGLGLLGFVAQETKRSCLAALRSPHTDPAAAGFLFLCFMGSKGRTLFPPLEKVCVPALLRLVALVRKNYSIFTFLRAE